MWSVWQGDLLQIIRPCTQTCMALKPMPSVTYYYPLLLPVVTISAVIISRQLYWAKARIFLCLINIILPEVGTWYT